MHITINANVVVQLANTTEVAEINNKLDKIQANQEILMATIDDVLADVTAQTTVVEGIASLVQGLKDQLAAQGVDQAKIDKAFAGLEANNAAMALLKNTPTPAPPTP